MHYSLTLHKDCNKVYIYSLNRTICLAKDIVITGELIIKLEQLAKAGKLWATHYIYTQYQTGT